MSDLSKTYFPGVAKTGFNGMLQFIGAALRSQTFLGESFSGATDGKLLERRANIGNMAWEDRAIGTRVLSLMDLPTEKRETVEIQVGGSVNGFRDGIAGYAPLTAQAQEKLQETIPADATRQAIRDIVEEPQNGHGLGIVRGMNVYDNGQGDHAILTTRHYQIGHGPWEVTNDYKFFNAQGARITEDDFKQAPAGPEAVV